MLRMDVKQRQRKLLHGLQIRRRVVYESTRATCGRDFAPQNQHIVFAKLIILRCEPALDSFVVMNVKFGFHNRFHGLVAQSRTVGTAAAKQVYGA